MSGPAPSALSPLKPSYIADIASSRKGCSFRKCMAAMPSLPDSLWPTAFSSPSSGLVMTMSGSTYQPPYFHSAASLKRFGSWWAPQCASPRKPSDRCCRYMCSGVPRKNVLGLNERAKRRQPALPSSARLYASSMTGPPSGAKRYTSARPGWSLQIDSTARAGAARDLELTSAPLGTRRRKFIGWGWGFSLSFGGGSSPGEAAAGARKL
mmetsp:Transcript_23516/g.56951  ORF Transcript_23516/g.56951 Transcript_23516/m.56951 type:complete len:209 (-) Transcript_23516:1684-2310(-)